MQSYLTPEAVAKLMDKRQRKGKGWRAKCPAHKDKTPSLLIDKGRKATLVYCQAGCTTKAVMEAVGLEVSMLYHDYDPHSNPRTHAARLLAQVLKRSEVRTVDELMPCQTLEDVLYRVVWAPPHVWAATGLRWQERLAEPFPQVMEDWWFRVTNGIIGDLLVERIEAGFDWNIKRQREMEARLWQEWDECGQS